MSKPPKNKEHAKADFLAAQNHVMPFGKNKGCTLDEIAQFEGGLKYLDWVRGQDWVKNPLLGHLNAYLNDPAIARELADQIESSDR